MSTVCVRTVGANSLNLTPYSVVCPFCHSSIIPNYLFIHGSKLFACCPNETCKHHFILSSLIDNRYIRIEPNAEPASKIFSEIINTTSPSFCVIFNQAYHAEQIGLNEICGVGYRKAIEFLIKDYLISKETDAQKIEKIKKKFLGNCIQEDVQDKNIREVAKRAVWLGNDETHYVRTWADKDINNLKHLIDLTVRWIENEIETERVLLEMN